MKNNKMIEIEAQLNLAAALGPAAYFSEESKELKIKLTELRDIEIMKSTVLFL